MTRYFRLFRERDPPSNVEHGLGFPANRTVAAFFGSQTWVGAEVEACARIDAGRVRLDIAGQGWRGPCEPQMNCGRDRR
jgi:hypothetical protein